MDNPIPRWQLRLIRLFLTLAVPILLVLASVRLVMTPVFIEAEYQRPDFPVDSYGFDTEDRLEYGFYALNYIFNAEDISFLEEQRLPGNLCFPPQEQECSLFKPMELQHMEDVKQVVQQTFLVGIGVFVATIALAVLLFRRKQLFELRIAFYRGSLLTLGLLAFGILLSLTSWNFFFDTFHSFFFEEGTWRFNYSDTLIRLYPEAFWSDAVLVVGGLTAAGALVILGVTRFLRPKPSAAAE